jgi:hypothetical protein
MSQMLLCQNEHGISLATDSRAKLYHSQGEGAEEMQVRKWFSLTPKVVAATVGAGYGIWLCENFQAYIQQHGLSKFEEVAEAALTFFRHGADMVRRQSAFTPDNLSMDKVYVLIAGFAPQQVQNEFPFLLLASEEHFDPVHVVPTTNIISIPRQLSLEHHLVRLTQSDSTLDEVESHFEKFLVSLASRDDAIGPPFHFLRITADGISVRTQESGAGDLSVDPRLIN